MRVFCLKFHTPYRCAHSGACCTAGWPISMESNGLRTLLPVTADGACVFFDRDGGRLCAIQRDKGAAAMPVACRNFPRVTLRDRRGVFITLSHFCPTAARLLLTAGDITIVEAPASISLGGTVEGLDATHVMPPLLRSGMLMDFDGYSAWEEAALRVLNDRRYPARLAIDLIAAATRETCGWSPGRDTLAAAVGRAFDRARTSQSSIEARGHRSFEHAIKAYLASHLFASWAAYQGGGLMAVVTAVGRALDLVDREFRDDEAFIETVREADLRLRHT